MTTQATHTPGPWSVSIDRDKYDSSMDDIRVLAEEERNHPQGPLTVAQVNQHLSGESVANAHLIAAAPETMAVLRRLDKWAEQDKTGAARDIQGIITEARQAIAYAEGRAGA